MGKFLCKRQMIIIVCISLAPPIPKDTSLPFLMIQIGRLNTVLRESKKTSYDYDSLGRVCYETIWEGNHPLIIKKFERDLLDRVLIETVENDSGEIQQKKRFVYDAKGRCIQEIIEIGNEEAAIIRKTYNLLNEPTQIIDALGNTTSIHYDYHHISNGQNVLLKTEVDPLGKQKLTEYDTQQRMTKIEEKDSFGTLISKENRFYDLNGQEVERRYALITPNEKKGEFVYKWNYNSMGNVIEEKKGAETPYEKIILYSYNDLGQKEMTLKPDGICLHHEYDLWDREKRVFSSDETIDLEYFYDNLNRLYRIRDNVFQNSSEKTFDSYGNVVQERLSNGLSLNLKYDLLDHITSITFPDSRTAYFSYNGMNLKTSSFVDQTTTFNSYDRRGLLIQQTLPVGEIHYSYDLKGRLLTKKDPYTYWKMSYDSVGNLLNKQWNDLAGDGTCDYTYNAKNQLIKEQGAFNHQYITDSLDNRLGSDQETYQVNSLNQIEAVANDHYQWDHNGNLIHYERQGINRDCRYDALDRLIEVIEGSTRLSYRYDGWHRRLERIEEKLSWSGYWNKQSHQRFLYIDEIECGAFNDQTLEELKIYFPERKADIGTTLFIEIKGILWIPLSNDRGDIIALVSPDGKQILESYRYDAFGVHSLDDCWLWCSGENPYRFQSKRKDPLTHWIHFGRRDYDPSLGRWMTPDPVGLLDGPNLYAYVHNNPLTHFDPDGRLDWDAYQKSFVDTFYNPRVQGSFQAFGGLVEMGVGAGMTYSTGGLAAPLGWPVLAHGMDQFNTGIATAVSGSHRDTLTSQLLQTTGMSSQTANLIDNSFSLFGTLGGGAVLGSARLSTLPEFSLPARGSLTDFIVGSNGVAIPTSRTVLESGFQGAGFTTFQTRSSGMGYIMPNGNRVRIMDPAGQAPLRASFTNGNGGPINPFTGKPPQPLRGLDGITRRQFVRENSHLELEP